MAKQLSSSYDANIHSILLDYQMAEKIRVLRPQILR